MDMDVWTMRKGGNLPRKNWNLVSMINLASDCKRTQMTESDLWRTLLKHRWSEEIFKSISNCPNQEQISKVILRTKQELGVGFNPLLWPVDDDDTVDLGFQLYMTLLYCPDNQDEKGRLATFFENLITHEYLTSVVASTMHNLKPRAGGNINDFSPVDMWYNDLDARYNFSLGPAVIALSTTEQLEHLAKLDPPYLTQYKAISNDMVPGEGWLQTGL